MKRHRTQSGFTLVELAIVLVIIGLIVGGVLVGQDLIRAATLRSAVTDIEKYNAAATTFRGKYDGLPGDILNSRATQFGFNTTSSDAARDGTPGHGDGDSRIAGCSGVSGVDLGCENVLFWADLSRAKLIPERTSLDSITAVTSALATKSTSYLANGILPQTRMRDTSLISVYTSAGRNFYAVGALSTGAAAAMTVNAGLSPLEAGSIDQKLDDGEPTTGTITAITALGVDDVAAPTGTSGCIGQLSAGEHYNTVNDTVAGTIACSIAVRTAF